MKANHFEINNMKIKKKNNNKSLKPNQINWMNEVNLNRWNDFKQLFIFCLFHIQSLVSLHRLRDYNQKLNVHFTLKEKWGLTNVRLLRKPNRNRNHTTQTQTDIPFTSNCIKFDRSEHRQASYCEYHFSVCECMVHIKELLLRHSRVKLDSISHCIRFCIKWLKAMLIWYYYLAFSKCWWSSSCDVSKRLD